MSHRNETLQDDYLLHGSHGWATPMNAINIHERRYLSMVVFHPSNGQISTSTIDIPIEVQYHEYYEGKVPTSINMYSGAIFYAKVKGNRHARVNRRLSESNPAYERVALLQLTSHKQRIALQYDTFPGFGGREGRHGHSLVPTSIKMPVYSTEVVHSTTR